MNKKRGPIELFSYMQLIYI